MRAWPALLLLLVAAPAQAYDSSGLILPFFGVFALLAADAGGTLLIAAPWAIVCAVRKRRGPALRIFMLLLSAGGGLAVALAAMVESGAQNGTPGMTGWVAGAVLFLLAVKGVCLLLIWVRAVDPIA